MLRRIVALTFCCALTVIGGPVEARRITATLTVTTTDSRQDLTNVAVWLTPVGDPPRGDAAAAKTRLRMVQETKKFTPHMLIVRVGSVVDFPNNDPFFHNVFSLYDGKRFDLGLYETGASRSVTFTRPGICYVFCNIHPEMSAVIVVVDTPYYGVSTRNGEVTLPDVPPGRYLLSVWHERYAAADGGDTPREVTITADTTALGPIRLVDSGKALTPHKNKYGHDYTPPPATSPLYH